MPSELIFAGLFILGALIAGVFGSPIVAVVLVIAVPMLWINPWISGGLIFLLVCYGLVKAMLEQSSGDMAQDLSANVTIHGSHNNVVIEMQGEQKRKG